jgi:hypothetical protein
MKTLFSRHHHLVKILILLTIAATLLGDPWNPALAAPVSSLAGGSQNPSWAKRFGGAGMDDGTRIALDPTGNIFLTGSFDGSTDFGGATLTSAGYEDIILAKFDPGGNPLWSMRFGGAGSEMGRLIATDSSGNVFFSGSFFSTLDLGGGPMARTGGGDDIFLAKFGPDGSHLWSQHFGGGSSQYATGLVVDPSGSVFLSGYFGYGGSSIDFGGGALTSAASSDMFLVKLDGSGNHVWSKRYGGSGSDYPSGLAIDPSGSLYVTGSFTSQTDLGSGTLVSQGSDDVFLAKYDGSGNPVWSKRFGTPSQELSYSIAAGPTGSITACGSFPSSIDFGGGSLNSAGQQDVFLATFDSGGNHLWSRRFGGSSVEDFCRIAADGSGNLAVTGYFYGSADFGGIPLVSAGGRDIFIARLSPDGSPLWSKRVGGMTNEESGSLAAGLSGSLFVTGAFLGQIVIGGKTLTSAGERDTFLAKFADYRVFLPQLRRDQ